MIKCRDILISFNNAYLTILVADDRLFTANCCFKLVFVATKVAHRAMTDMLSKEREREIDDEDARRRTPTCRRNLSCRPPSRSALRQPEHRRTCGTRARSESVAVGGNIFARRSRSRQVRSRQNGRTMAGSRPSPSDPSTSSMRSCAVLRAADEGPTARDPSFRGSVPAIVPAIVTAGSRGSPPELEPPLSWGSPAQLRGAG